MTTRKKKIPQKTSLLKNFKVLVAVVGVFCGGGGVFGFFFLVGVRTERTNQEKRKK